MFNKHLQYFLFFLLSSVLLSACSSQKKVIAAWEELRSKEPQLNTNEKALDDLNEQIKKKAENNEIDDTTAVRIQRFVGVSKAEIDKLQAQKAILEGKTAIDKSDWETIRKDLEITNELLKSTADKLTMINDLLSRTLVLKIDDDIIFEPGKYKVSAAATQTISKIFDPSANEIESFVKKYPGVDLSVVINANGFADGTSIAEGTSLYKDLKAGIKILNPTNKDLNKELSRLRAEEAMGLFKKYFDQRFQPGKNLKSILYTFEGKGDELPNPKIPDYKTDDERRRVVLLYWSVFPD
jgi:flagellar motor protein MotB